MLVSIMIFILASSQIIQADTLWHIKVGEWIVENLSIPTKDCFSMHQDLNFIAHEWLFDVIYFGISEFAGITGIVAFTLLIIFIANCFVIFKSGNPTVAIIVLFLLSVSKFYKPYWAIPDTFGVVLLVFMSYLLVNDVKKKHLIVAITTVLMVNYQGGIVCDLIVSTLFILGVKTYLHRDLLKENLFIFCEIFLCSLINPYFISNYKYVFVSNLKISQIMPDWEYFCFKNILSIFVVVILVIFLIAGYLKSTRKEVMDLVVLFFYLILLLRFNRTMNAFVYAFILFGTKYIAVSVEKIKVEKILNISLGVSLILVISVLLNTTIKHQTVDEYIEEHYLSQEVAETLRNNKVFNDFGLGGFLVYKDIKVFMDGRIDCYVPEFGNPDIVTEYLEGMYSKAKMDLLCQKYGFKYLVFLPNSLNLELHKASGLWVEYYKSENLVILERK